MIFQNIEVKLYIYSTSLTTEQLVILYVNTKTELDQLKKKQMVTKTLLTLETQQNQYEKTFATSRLCFLATSN